MKLKAGMGQSWTQNKSVFHLLAIYTESNETESRLYVGVLGLFIVLTAHE
jgi:hypothetical protein